MTLINFLAKQFISVIEWNEPEDGILAYRYPMRDLEIQNGGQLTVSESQMAAFVNEGKIADIFGPGLHTLNTRNLPILTDLMNWDKDFESPFKSEVYFFSTRLQIDQKWGTATPITIRDKEFGAVRLRCFGIYSYRIADPRVFFNQVSGTRDVYFAADLEGQLRDTILAHMTRIFAASDISVSRSGRQPGRAGAEDRRADEAGLRRARPRTERSSSSRTSPCPTNLPRSSISASAWAWWATWAATRSTPRPSRSTWPPPTPAAAPAWAWVWAPALPLPRCSATSLKASAAARRLRQLPAPAAAAAAPAAASRGRHQVLHRLRKAHPGARQFLSGVRQAAMNCPSCGAPMPLKPDTEGYRCDYCHAVFFRRRGRRDAGSRLALRPEPRLPALQRAAGAGRLGKNFHCFTAPSAMDC